MKHATLAAAPLAMTGTLLAGCAASANPEALVADWKVDLRPTPSSPAYYQQFTVDRVVTDPAEGESEIVGTFYGSPIHEGRLNTEWNNLYFAFTTSDDEGQYNHSGMLRAGKIDGLSHSIARDTLWVWTAVPE